MNIYRLMHREVSLHMQSGYWAAGGVPLHRQGPYEGAPRWKLPGLRPLAGHHHVEAKLTPRALGSHAAASAILHHLVPVPPLHPSFLSKMGRRVAMET